MASAQPQSGKAEPEASTTPIGQRDASATDVVTTPVSDLNLKKGEIPAVLTDAETAPYSLSGLRGCKQISAEVGQLDAALGDDIDIAQAPNGKLKAGKVAQSVIGSFIPFRGIIREISGANEQERRLQAAIYAGIARRSFLKGVGQQRGCQWPARSATPQMLAKIAGDSEAKAKQESDDKKAKSDKP